ncbi:MAG TPA: MmcQ/YjbR family DNA-binding protein [Steroidobacteraceae bacterium]|nr:MmcQ/YjbR family DNA-binding protein [Steroidobacteraceae bacterium]
MAVLTFDTVRTLGLSLPDVVDGTAYGLPALKLGGKVLACMPANKSAEANSIVVRIDLEQRAELLREHPETYYITDHYAPHPTVLVRLSKITRTDLQELLRDACRFISSSTPKSAGRTRRLRSE